MARENTASLYGWIETPPQIRYDIKTNSPVKAMFSILTMRRPFKNSNNEHIAVHYSRPLIWTNKKEIISKIMNFKPGDMVSVKGVYTTRNVLKVSICPCGKQNSFAGVKSYITPIAVYKEEFAATIEDAMVLLQDRMEVSNDIKLIGNLCADPKYYEQNGKNMNCEYQVAANRSIRLNEYKDEPNVDYPVVKSYGKQAHEDYLRLSAGSQILVDASLQTRPIVRSVTCEHCGKVYTINDEVMELVPYSVEYLSKCDLRPMVDGVLVDYPQKDDEAEE